MAVPKRWCGGALLFAAIESIRARAVPPTTYILAHMSRPAEIGPFLIPPGIVVIGVGVFVPYSVEEGQQQAIRDLSVSLKTSLLRLETNPIKNQIQHQILLVLHERRCIGGIFYLARLSSEDLSYS